MNENRSLGTNMVRLQINSNLNANQASLNNNNSIQISGTSSSTNIQLTSPSISKIIKDKGEVCFKGESLQQLSTNSLPPYAPDSPPNMLKGDATFKNYCCTDCGDTFLVKDSLTFHLERRSVAIKFPCDACKSVQIFYNRCTLLSHIRTHADLGETSDISKGTVYPLPRILMDALQNELINNLDDEPATVDDANQTSATDLLEFSLNEIESENPLHQLSRTLEKKDENKNVVKVKCLDCNEEFDSPEERAQHLTQNDKITSMLNICSKCNLICPSKCFLKAHQRIHLQVSPYVCPECGESPSPMWQNFQFHVKLKCFHNARHVGYKCPLCSLLTSSNESLLKHMEVHTDKFFKCDSCIRAFTNVATFQSHADSDHCNDEKRPSHTIIFKCAMCDIVFLNKDQVPSHRASHLKDKTCEYIFNCMQCGKPLESKKLLSEHIKSYHPKIYKTLSENLEINTQRTEPPVVTYKGKVECLLCSSIFQSYQGYKVHITKNHINQNQPCTYCYMVLSNRQLMIQHGKKHLNKGSFLCLLCNNKRWQDARQLDNHLFKHVSRLQYCSFCPICDQIMKSLTDAIHHLREEHMLFELMETNTKPPQARKKGKDNLFCFPCRRSFGKLAELQEHLQTIHLVESNSTNEKNDSDEPLAKVARVEGSVCAKCDFHSTDREKFKKHILTHKVNKTSLQCQECGICFMVEPALQKHLRVVHKITDTKKYIEKEGTNCMPDVDSNAEVSTCNSLLCNVCFTTFPNETALKTHMRSHGMAFIHKLQNSETP